MDAVDREQRAESAFVTDEDRERMQARRLRRKGFLMVLTGSTLWGLSGTAAQMLFQHDGFRPAWLVTVRMLVSGLLLLGFARVRSNSADFWGIWRRPTDRRRLLVFAMVGLCGVQYTYFASIHRGNAATATLLQYVGPSLITVYLALVQRRPPRRPESAAVGLALVGTLCLVTNGSFTVLVVPQAAVLWGLLSAVALAFYTLYPRPLLKRWGAWTVVGWSMLVGGIAFSGISPPWAGQGEHWTWASVGLVVFVVLLGTLVAFSLYLGSLRYITPAEAALLASAEPVAATVAGVWWLRLPLGGVEVLGGFFILVAVGVLARRRTAD